jgi:hypothetical protein
LVVVDCRHEEAHLARRSPTKECRGWKREIGKPASGVLAHAIDLAAHDPDPSVRRRLMKGLEETHNLTHEILIECAWNAGLGRDAMTALIASTRNPLKRPRLEAPGTLA